MAENQAAPALEEQPFQYNVTVEDAGPATKKVSVQIPSERIANKLQEQFKELRREAAVPGFRPGHAPQKLIEKRFHDDVREQVRRTLISESYEQAVKKNSLHVIGEPEFDNPDAIKLPDQGDLTYSFLVEVQPEIKLPKLDSLAIRKPKVEVTDENIEQALTNLRQQQGTLAPVEDRGVEAMDHLLADVHVKSDGNEIVHNHDVTIIGRPGRLAGIEVDDLDKQLAGMRPGETRTISVHVPETHTDESIRGKDVQIEVALKDLKRLISADLDQMFLDNLGFRSEQELRDALRQQMDERIKEDVQQVMRNQIEQYLLDNVTLELPSKLSDRQAERVVQRRTVALMVRGMPREQIDENLDRLRSGAKEEALRELKLFFILQQIASDLKIEVGEAELNGRVAALAVQNGQRPEKLKIEMAQDGTLANLYVQMREQKAIDKILATADLQEVNPDAVAARPS